MFASLQSKPQYTLMFQFSDASSQSRASPDTAPVRAPSMATSMVVPQPGSTSAHPKPSSRSRSRNHIPRPRNAFMIFRSEFCAEEKISRSVERDHRHISRIIGYYWNKMPEEEKDVWRRKAEQEKSEHLRKYPGYRFTPTVRTKRPVKRNVKRNGAGDLLRCQLLADLLILGKEGDELESAAKSLEPETQAQPGMECSAHSAQEGVDVLAYSCLNLAVDARSLPFHTNDVLDASRQNSNSGMAPTNSVWELQEALESRSNSNSHELLRSFHRPQEYILDAAVYYRPARDRHAAAVPNWQQSGINLRRTVLMGTTGFPQHCDPNFVDSSASEFTTYFSNQPCGSFL